MVVGGDETNLKEVKHLEQCPTPRKLSVSVNSYARSYVRNHILIAVRNQKSNYYNIEFYI